MLWKTGDHWCLIFKPMPECLAHGTCDDGDGSFSMASAASGSGSNHREATPTNGAAPVDAQGDIVPSDEARGRECFVPITTAALIDRLSHPSAWPAGESPKVRRFFTYLEFWRRHQLGAFAQELLRSYEPFSPDSDLLITREYSPDEKRVAQKHVVDGVSEILRHANYKEIKPSDVEVILTKESHYGLDLQVDFSVFEECLVFYRGASSRRDQRRTYKKFLRKEEFDVPIFQRLFLLFKLKPFDVRVSEVMASHKVSRKEAEKLVKKLRGNLPPEMKEGNIYMKLFKNIPRSDVEMIFPNTRVRFRMLDKLKLGITGGGAVGMGVIGTASKLAAGGLTLANPVALAGAVAGLGGIAFRQGVNFMNQKQRYMVVMAQNLYFHAMADNRGVITKLADRAAEEDVKEEILLYSVLAKEQATRADIPAIDAAIEQYLYSVFGVSIDFDVEDALDRLLAEGLVVEGPDGRLHTMPPDQAAQHLDAKWDRYLDDLPELTEITEGHEFGETGAVPHT
jgi:hypothetical protein